jgi:large conductance mechanosensitive channel
MIKEFKEFAFKGNLIDMAVGIVIGSAFGTVVKSLVDDVVMPIVGLLTGGIDFSDRFAVLKHAEGKEDAVYLTAAAAREAGATVMSWGSFISAFISFVIVALVLFLVIKKVMGAIEGKLRKPAAPVAPVEPSEDVKLLTEIRDLLKAK